ncbi:PAS domain-containing sensor histidine kinase [Sphingosinicella sp. CPCC 101087]|uniref:sensor histidine kinase n=1 Tax=Sphingosinicella sp. CPCC 101087 TaxID=2497754 RepID=UPI00101BB248|nr:HAMP domain-containing sensor histidine kinase [Sphingosinicella sp. CPCC 101087]
MASRPLAFPDLLSAAGWRFLVAACLVAALVQMIAGRHYATALVFGAALGLTLFDAWRLAGRRANARADGPTGGIDTARRLDRALALLDAVTVALFALDPDGRVRFANRAARALAGFEVARLQDIPLLGASGASRILSLPPGGRQLISLVDGRSMLVWVGTVSAPGEGPQRLVSMQAVAGELDAVQVGAWHRMTRVLAHEMMNSLTPIASISESLSRWAKEADVRPEIASGVATIARRGQHLMRFVERYRAVVDLPQPELAEIGLAAFLADIERLVGGELRQRGIDFAVEPAEPGWHVRADPGMIEQAVLNLIKNAADAVAATPEARIRLGCTRAGGLVILSVSDNGIGVPQDQLEEIFVPFYTTKNEGAGIGLTLSRQIALAHGGRLTARPASDKGTIFDLVLAG